MKYYHIRNSFSDRFRYNLNLLIIFYEYHYGYLRTNFIFFIKTISKYFQ